MNKCNILEDLVRKLPPAEQSGPEKVLSAVWEMWNEVHCDGFAFYFVYEAEAVPIIAQALGEIGASQSADICRRAIKVAFVDGLPKTPEEFPRDPHESSEEICQRLDELDREFYKHPDDIEGLTDWCSAPRWPVVVAVTLHGSAVRTVIL